MLKRLLSLGAAAVASVVAACEEGPATVSGTWRSPATWSTMVYASSAGPMLVEVLGQPFANLSPESLSGHVADSMTGQLIGRPITFTADQAQAPRPQFRVILAFNAADTTDPKSLCAGKVVLGAPAEKITLIASFCDDGQMLASVKGWVARIDGPTDSRFRRLIGQVTRELFGNPQ
ncbi:MAG: hypothetical protein HQL42_03115 [Alphaproteobacteria bacterium]|nr:hypothetical protein [Alphaproteobacteria bacterium]